MKRLLIITLFLLSFLEGFSQELAAEIKLSLEKDRKVFQIVDEIKKEVSFFISDKKNITAIKFNSEFKAIDSLKTERPDAKFESIIGYSMSDTKYIVYWTSAQNKEINLQEFDFSQHKVENSTYKLELKKETVLQVLSVNNNFYIISVVKNSDILKLYVFDKNGNLDIKTIDTSPYPLVDLYGKKANLYEVFEEDFLPYETGFSLKAITAETPTSLAFAAFKRKIYAYHNELILSFDNNIKFTQLYKINLTDFSISQVIIKQPTNGFINVKDVYNASNTEDVLPDINSNSFIVNNKIFQIRLSADLVIISIKNLDGSEIKSYTARYNEPINFKNTDIIQANKSIKNTRVLETSNQFIRKLYLSNPAISCFEKQGQYYATIGSASQLVDNNAALFAIGGLYGGVAGVLLVNLLTYNPNLENFNSYKNRKVIYINSLFDTSLNHVEGNIKPLAFDELRKFAFSKNKDSDFTVFKFDNFLYLGSYNVNSKIYTFNKFLE